MLCIVRTMPLFSKFPKGPAAKRVKEQLPLSLAEYCWGVPGSEFAVSHRMQSCQIVGNYPAIVLLTLLVDLVLFQRLNMQVSPMYIIFFVRVKKSDNHERKVLIPKSFQHVPFRDKI